MAGRSGQLSLTQTVRLSAGGTGFIQVGPTYHDEVWHLTSVGVACTSTTKQSTVTGYLNNIGGPQIGASYAGNNDTGPAALDLMANQSVVFVWTGADPNSVATLSLYGTREW